MTNHCNGTERTPADGRSSRRDEIVLEHLDYVKTMARLMATDAPVPVDENDLVQAGVVGLLDALEQYDAANDGAFDEYARPRIQAAIAESLRQFGPGPRRTDSGMTTDRNADRPTRHGAPLRRGTCTGSSPAWRGAVRGMPEVAAAPELQPDRICELSDLRRTLAHAIDCLPRRFQKVMLLSCDDDLTLEQIGAQIGVSGVRVSQLRRKAMEKMRVELRSAGVAPPRHSMMGLARLATQGGW